MSARELTAPVRTRPDDRPTLLDPGPAPARTTPAWRVVAAREIAVKLRDRNFLVATGVLLLLLIGSLVVQGVLAARSGHVDLAVTGRDATSVVQRAGSAARAAGSSVEFSTTTLPSVADVERQVRDGSVDAGLVPTADGQGWRLIGDTERNTDAAQWVGTAVAAVALDRDAAAAGLDPAALRRGAAVGYDLLQPDGDRARATAKVCAVVFGLLFYLAALVFGTALATSVVEEKQNRVVEILAAAVPVRQLLVGKVVAATVLATAQVVLLAGLGTAGLLATGNTGMLELLGGGVGWFLAFFLVGFVALSCLWAVVGSVATRAEDIQSTSPPVTVLVMAIFFLALFLTGLPLKVVSFVPLLSTTAMPVRVISGDASWWEAALSLLVGLLGAVGVIRVAERMYRASLMQTNRRTSFREALGR
ncbi:ABC transporter permease [Kineococcus rhizosphaerae]|uniref:ABC-2 type transport system permease protein n=1 Tax=Kineococcus rhizosphaerae TaxID=559628 RepID=A0A2T0QYQ2_9ACTN|nr:ABC transporter permease [Kineococcus rhizosphaerae]PRY11503.1 ABC-2 type transport system permease protein [Kineococcus rhizosphaerae]